MCLFSFRYSLFVRKGITFLLYMCALALLVGEMPLLLFMIYCGFFRVDQLPRVRSYVDCLPGSMHVC